MEARMPHDMTPDMAADPTSEEGEHTLEAANESVAEADDAEGAVEAAADDAEAADDFVEDAESEGGISLSVDTDAAAEQLRMIEALLFAAAEPLDEETLAHRLPAGADVGALIAALQETMQGRGVELARIAGGWRLQTPADLDWLLEEVREERRKLSGAARETLAIIAYHQPVTRAEVEEVRGVAVSKGTLDMLMDLGWVRMRGRRKAPGRPVTYGTTDMFLAHFGLDSLGDLPGKAELKAAGLLDSRLPADFTVPDPTLFDGRDEDPLEAEGVEESEFHIDFLEEDTEEETPAQAQTA